MKITRIEDIETRLSDLEDNGIRGNHSIKEKIEHINKRIGKMYFFMFTTFIILCVALVEVLMYAHSIHNDVLFMNRELSIVPIGDVGNMQIEISDIQGYLSKIRKECSDFVTVEKYELIEPVAPQPCLNTCELLNEDNGNCILRSCYGEGGYGRTDTTSAEFHACEIDCNHKVGFSPTCQDDCMKHANPAYVRYWNETICVDSVLKMKVE